MLKKSPFLFLFEKRINGNDVLALFLSHKLKKLYFVNEGKNKIKNILDDPNLYHQSDLVSKLLEDGFLVDFNRSKEDELKPILTEFVPSEAEIEVAYILPTTACNYRCKYCFVEGSEFYKPETMNNNTLEKAVIFALNSLKNSKRKESKLVVYGGEPLLRKDLVLKIFNLASQYEDTLDKKLAKVLITNGSNIDDNLAKYFKENNIKVAVSLDGMEEIHDHYRIDSKGKGTFSRTFNGIQLLKQFKVPLTISATITDANVERLPEITTWVINTINPLAIGYNVLVGYEFNKSMEELAKKTSKALIESFEVCRNYGVYEDTMIRKVEAFVEEVPYVFNCAATGGQLVIDPKGRIGLCHGFYGNPNFFPLNLDSSLEEIKNNPLFGEWSNRTPFNMDECNSCEAMGICGGGCPYNVYLEKKSIWGLDKFNCIHAKEALEWMIWDLYRIIEHKVLKDESKI